MTLSKCNILKFSGSFQKEGDYYIAICDQLPLSAFGKSKKEAVEGIFASIDLYFKTQRELEQLPEILKRYNLKPKLVYTTTNEGFEAKCPMPV